MVIYINFENYIYTEDLFLLLLKSNKNISYRLFKERKKEKICQLNLSKGIK